MSFLRLDSLVQLGMGFFLVGVENKLGQKWGGRSPPKPLEILKYTFLRGWAKNPRRGKSRGRPDGGLSLAGEGAGPPRGCRLPMGQKKRRRYLIDGDPRGGQTAQASPLGLRPRGRPALRRLPLSEPDGGIVLRAVPLRPCGLSGPVLAPCPDGRCWPAKGVAGYSCR